MCNSRFKRPILHVSTLAALCAALPALGQNVDILVPDDSATIQSAVDAADPGDVVGIKAKLSGDPYIEQIVIAKDLTLLGLGDTPPVVESPTSPGIHEIPESSATWEPVVFAHGTGSSTISVDISGLIIDGAGRQPSASRATGVLLRNVQHSTITENDIVNMGVGGKTTFGIMVYGESDVMISYNHIEDYERGGIGANGDGSGVNPTPKVSIRNNRVISGSGIPGEKSAPNGIQIGYGAEGDITSNIIRDSRWYTDDGDWSASGILVFEANGVRVADNVLENNDVAIGVESWGWFLPSADNVHVNNNHISNANTGISLGAIAWAYSGSDSSVSNCKVINNQITDDGNGNGVIGILVQAYDAHPDFDPLAKNNKIIRNTISGFDTPVFQSGDTETKAQASVISP